MFTIFPAIDLKEGRCVRLRQGRADEVTVYSGDPVDMARQWEAAGATYLHVVDLDGAFQGRPVHTEVIGRIARALSIPVEVGGGLRTDADLRAVLDAGAARAIIGTRAFAEPEKLEALAREFGEKLVVGIDARDGRVQIKGWVETSALSAVDLARTADQTGVKTLIYTDTATDGMLDGPNVKAVTELCRAVKCRVVASGGVSKVADVRALCDLRLANLDGVIVGKALYEGRVTLADLLKESGQGKV
jgi:phosphoribosylformimino-5-aminoimidazole carboxamide ribotide isomerase